MSKTPRTPRTPLAPAPNPPASASLRTDGPTLDEFVAAGNKREDYPPAGFAVRDASTAEVERKPIAVSDVLDGWTVDAIDGQDVRLSNGVERRTRPLAELEREREDPATRIAVGDVIDDFTVLAINGPEDVVCVNGHERRTLTIKDLVRAKRAAQTLTAEDLARPKQPTPPEDVTAAGVRTTKPKS